LFGREVEALEEGLAEVAAAVGEASEEVISVAKAEGVVSVAAISEAKAEGAVSVAATLHQATPVAVIGEGVIPAPIGAAIPTGGAVGVILLSLA